MKIPEQLMNDTRAVKPATQNTAALRENGWLVPPSSFTQISSLLWSWREPILHFNDPIGSIYGIFNDMYYKSQPFMDR